MFVHEYGNDCPSANKRSVFVSYLDSVPVSAYPRYTKGLKLALERGSIAGYGNLFERIGNEPKKVVQWLPYLPGFLWPAKAETIIEEVSRPRAAFRCRRRLLPGWRVPGAPKEVVRDLPPRRGLRQNRRLLPPRQPKHGGHAASPSSPRPSETKEELQSIHRHRRGPVLPTEEEDPRRPPCRPSSAGAQRLGEGRVVLEGPLRGLSQADASGSGGDGALGSDATQQGSNKKRRVADGSDADSGGCYPVVLKLM
ncbi:unnamed protein product [Ectocarpus sp. 12 AP-2014]